MQKVNITETNLSFTNPIPERYSTDLIIIRDTIGVVPNNNNVSAQELHDIFISKKYLGIGYHFVVRKDGIIERGLPIYARGIHTVGHDWHSIGIHVSGYFENEGPSSQQIEALSLLIANLASKYNLEISRDTVKGAKELLDPYYFLSPGRNLDLTEVVGKAKWYFNEGGNAVQVSRSNPDDPMLSEHFSTSEFWCHGKEQGTCSCNHSCLIDPRLVELLEQLRSNIGGLPLYCNSGYRCYEHNAAVGGVPNSQHALGKAADIEIPSSLSFDQFHWYIEQLPFDGIGLYYAGNFIHLDVRDGGIGSHILFYGS